MASCSERRKPRLYKCNQRQRKHLPHIVSCMEYIHLTGACCTYIQGYKRHRAFIITQGPMQSTSRDFWKMVCSRKCSVIVMLSDLVEQGEVRATRHLTYMYILAICTLQTTGVYFNPGDGYLSFIFVRFAAMAISETS